MSLIPYDYDNDDLLDIFDPLSDPFGTRKLFSRNPIRMDVIEGDSSFKVLADIPSGASKNDIKLEFDKGYLTLNVSFNSKRKCNSEDCGNSGRFVIRERSSSAQFSRRMFIAEGLDGNNVKASFNNNVLEVTIPKLKNQNGASKFINID